MCCSVRTQHSLFIYAFLLGIPVACLHPSLRLLHTQWCLSGVCSRLHLPTGSPLVKVGVAEGVRLHLLGGECLCKLFGMLIYGSVVSSCCLFNQGTFYMLGYNPLPRHPAPPLVPALALGALSGSPVSPGHAPSFRLLSTCFISGAPCCSRPIWCHPCPSPGLSHFSREPCPFLGE